MVNEFGLPDENEKTKMNFKPLPKPSFLPSPSEFKEKTNEHPFMQNNGLKVVDITTYTFLKICVVVLLLIFGVFAYFTYDGKFQTQISQNFTCPDIPACPACSSDTCTCQPVTNCNFPQNFSVNVKLNNNSS